MTTPKNNDETVTRLEAVKAASELAGEVGGLARAVKDLGTDQGKLRRIQKWLVVSLVFDLILTVVIGGLSVNNHELNSRLHQSAIKSCQQSNVVRQDDIQLWTTAINDIDPASKITTEAQAEAKANFIKFIDHTFRAVDCAKVN